MLLSRKWMVLAVLGSGVLITPAEAAPSRSSKRAGKRASPVKSKGRVRPPPVPKKTIPSRASKPAKAKSKPRKKVTKTARLVPAAVRKAGTPPRTSARASASAQLGLRQPKHEKERSARYKAVEKRTPRAAKKLVARQRKAAAKKGLRFVPQVTAASTKSDAELTGLIIPPDYKKREKARHKVAAAKQTKLKLPSMEVATRSRLVKAPIVFKRAVFMPQGSPSVVGSDTGTPSGPSPEPGVVGDGGAPKVGSDTGVSANALPYGANSATACDASLAEWSWIDAMSPVESQGFCGTCWVFASVDVFEASQRIRNNAMYSFSEQAGHDCARDPSRPCPGGGGRPADMMEQLSKQGLPNEEAVPYTAGNNECSAHPSSNYTAMNYDYVGAVPWAPSVDELKKSLCEHGPVVTTMAVSSSAGSFAKHYREGVLDEPQVTTWRTDHAVTLVGWSESLGAWLIKNSWGEDWGIDGYAWVAYGSNNIGKHSMWVDANPGGFGGKDGHGWFLQNALYVRNDSEEPLKVELQHRAWTGEGGWQWFPEQKSLYGDWYSYELAPGEHSFLRSGDVGRVRGFDVMIKATGKDSGKTWDTTRIELLQDGPYWASAMHSTQVHIGDAGIYEGDGTQSSPGVSACPRVRFAGAAYAAPTSKKGGGSWDALKGRPDLRLRAVFPDESTAMSDVSNDSYSMTWTPAEGLTFVTNKPARVEAWDYDNAGGYDFMGNYQATLPGTFSGGNFELVGEAGQLVLKDGQCIE